MEKKTRTWTKWLYWFTFAVAVIIVYKTVNSIGEIAAWVKNLLNILMPFGIGLLIAYILYVPCKRVETILKKSKTKIVSKKARPISVFMVYVITLIIIIIIFNFILPPIVESVADLTNNFQDYYNMAIKTINELPEDSILKSEAATTIIEGIKNIDIKQFFDFGKVTQYIQGAIGLVNGIINTFVAIIVSVYILTSRSQIIAFLKKFGKAVLNSTAYNNIDKYFNRTNEIFFNFIASQLLDAIVVGIMTSIAMSLLGVKYAVLLGFMIGLFNMIPYVGAIIAVIIATIITFFTGGLTQAIWMVVIVTILQQIDANIINPKIVGNSLKINPLLVIFAITIGGAYFGMLGIFLSVPVVAVVKVLIDDFIESKSQKGKKQKEIKEAKKVEE